jgi:uncharacterized protein (DUF927 family)
MNKSTPPPASRATPKQPKYPTQADYARIAAAALASAESVLANWLPNGKRHGAEWVSTNPTRSDGQPGSFSINMTTGKWSDFATGDKGGDLISLVAYLEGCGHMSDAAASLAVFLSIAPVEGDYLAPAAGLQCLTKHESKQETEWPIMPIPAEAMAQRPSQHAKYGKPSAEWIYSDADGRPLAIQRRFDPAGERKQFIPQTYWMDGWKAKAPPEPRHLYGLDRLVAQPDAPVLLCEGEKSADAAAGLMPDYVCIASMNGAQSPAKSDWTPLRGRTLFVWPDNDPPGQDYAKAAARLALNAGAVSVAVLDLASLAINPGSGESDELPEGWDAANAMGSGWTPDDLAAHLRWMPFKDETTQAKRATKTVKNRKSAGTDPSARTKTGLPDGFELVADGAAGKRPGLYFVQSKNRTTGDEDDGPKQTIERIWLCGLVRVTAFSRNREGAEWGRVLEFSDHDGRLHRVVIDLPMLAGTGEGMRVKLMNHGLEISTLAEARRRLMDFILQSHPKVKARITHKTGWLDGVFVLPDRIIGPSSADPVIFSSEAETPAFICRGSLMEWQDNIARYAVGNDFLTFVLSLGLAPALLEFTNSEGCIFHLRGKSTGTSSSGKTTLQRAVLSVSGAPDTLRRWRLTDNSLEATCESFNDLCLCLDELAQMDPKAAGDAAYLIAHGEGKGRLTRDNKARTIRRWRTIGLSSGEISLEEHMAVAERKHKSGQAVRFIEMTADAGAGMGVFADLHGFPGPAQFADHLRDAAAEYYGTALQAWLEWIVAHRTELASRLRDFRVQFVERALSGLSNPESTVRRVCEKFALVAVAGELGIDAGILPWRPGDAVEATGALFAEWVQTRGGAGSQEEARLIEQVRDFLARHGESRFTDFHRAKQGDDRAPRTVNRAGFVIRYREADGLARDSVTEEDGQERTPTSSEFLVFPAVFRSEMCAGYDYRDAEKALARAGILMKGKDGRMTCKPRLPGFRNPPRVYRLTLDDTQAGAT